MGGLFGGGGGDTSTTENVASGMSIQSSTQGLPVPIVYGTTRIVGNLLWTNGLKAHPHTSTVRGGKGGKKKKRSYTYYTYTAGIVLGLCEGGISSIERAWSNKDKTDAEKLGLSTFHGDYGQVPWGYLTTNYPSVAYSYKGTAYVATADLELGRTTSIPNMSFEVNGLLGGSDKPPAQIITDLLANRDYGLGMDDALIEYPYVSFDFCAWNKLVVSPAYATQRSAAEMIAELAMIGLSEVVFSEGRIKVKSYVDYPTGLGGYINAAIPTYAVTTELA